MKKFLCVFLAISMMLCTGLAASADTVSPYGVKYDAYVQKAGWTPVVENGQTSGTMGRSLRVEAFRAHLVANGTATASDATASDAAGTLPAGAKIEYQAFVQGLGWQFVEANGGIAGTRGRALRIEAFRITLVNMPGYAVQYRAYVQHVGWQAWKTTKNGTALGRAALAGTTGRRLRVEAIQIRLRQV